MTSRSAAFQPRAVVGRELDGFLFQVVVLRLVGGGEAADIAYADDGNIERAVPLDELVAGPGGGAWAFGTAAVDRLFEESLALLAAEDAHEVGGGDTARRPTLADAEQGFFDDGAVIIMTATPPAQPEGSAVVAAGAIETFADVGAADTAADDGAASAQEPEPAPSPTPEWLVVNSAELATPWAPPPATLTESPSSPQLQACGAGLKGIRSLRALQRDVQMVA